LGLTLGGSVAGLGGVLVRILGNGPSKRAVWRYNDLQMGRTAAPVYPGDGGAAKKRHWPIVLPLRPRSRDTINEIEVKWRAEKARRVAGFRDTIKGIKIDQSWFGLAVGIGRAKQKLSYENAFDEPLKHAAIYSFGLQYGKRVTDQFGWQLELCLTQHGFREETNTTTQGVKVNAKTDARIRYLEVPLLLNLRLPVGGEKIRLEALPGLSLGYATSARIVSRGNGSGKDTKVRLRTSSKIDLSDTKFADRLDAALLLGLRGSKDFNRGRLFFEARYHFGVLNLERNASIFSDERPKVFNRTLLLRAGYQVALPGT
jgi:Outer membrane protein beta-barrel domain